MLDPHGQQQRNVGGHSTQVRPHHRRNSPLQFTLAKWQRLARSEAKDSGVCCFGGRRTAKLVFVDVSVELGAQVVCLNQRRNEKIELYIPQSGKRRQLSFFSMLRRHANLRWHWKSVRYLVRNIHRSMTKSCLRWAMVVKLFKCPFMIYSPLRVTGRFRSQNVACLAFIIGTLSHKPDLPLMQQSSIFLQKLDTVRNECYRDKFSIIRFTLTPPLFMDSLSFHTFTPFSIAIVSK